MEIKLKAMSCSMTPVARRVRQRRHRYRADGRGTLPPGHGRKRPVDHLLHVDVDEGSVALRRQQVVSDVLALRNASLHLWYEKGDQTHEPVDGCHAGMMDLSQVDLPDNATI
jgi:hypothetical protein